MEPELRLACAATALALMSSILQLLALASYYRSLAAFERALEDLRRGPQPKKEPM